MRINDAFDYMVHLVSCAIHKTTPESLPEGITYEDVLSCALYHDLAGFAYLGVMRAEEKPNPDTMNKWYQKYLLGIRRNSEQLKARDEMVSMFHENGIATIEVQGTRVKKYYPSPDLRLMGDIDIIIEKKHLPEADKILKQLGYETTMQGDYEVDGQNRTIHVEIHTVFFPPSHEFSEIFSDPFKDTEIGEDQNADVSDTVFWLYHLLHCLKHYNKKGIGFRRVLDLYFLAPEMEKTTDTAYINDFLSKNGLMDDVLDLFAIGKYLFDGTETDRDIDKALKIIKSAGSQGTTRIFLNKKFSDMSSEGKHFVKLRYFLSLVFPKKENIYIGYQFCRKHKLPYPLAWLYRAVRIPFKPGRMKLLVRYIKSIRNAKSHD